MRYHSPPSTRTAKNKSININQKTQQPNICENVKKLDYSYIADNNVKCYDDAKKQFVSLFSFFGVNVHLLYEPAITLLDISPEEMDTHVLIKFSTRLFIAVYLHYAKSGGGITFSINKPQQICATKYYAAKKQKLRNY